MEYNSVPLIFFINSIHHFFSKLSSLCSHPLFSTYVTLYTLILLYAPSFFLRIVLSPIFNSTAIILISLLRLGAKETSGNVLIVQESKIPNSSENERLEKEFDCLKPRVLDHKDQYERGSIDDLDLVQELSSLEPRFLDFLDQTQTHVECNDKEDSCLESTQNHANSKPILSYLNLQSNQLHIEFDHDIRSKSNSHDDYHKWEFLDTNSMESSQVNEEEETSLEKVSKRVDTTMKLLELNMKAPLEVIYEAYEGEEEDDQESNENRKISSDKNAVRSCERYPSLSMYYPESETDSSSDNDFSINENWETQESVLLKWEDEDEDDREELIEISLDRYGKRSIEFCHVEEDNLIEIDIFPTRN